MFEKKKISIEIEVIFLIFFLKFNKVILLKFLLRIICWYVYNICIVIVCFNFICYFVGKELWLNLFIIKFLCY